MAGKTLNDYSIFVKRLARANDLQQQVSAIYDILDADKLSQLAHGEAVKAFLIHLAVETFGYDYRSDIVLCSWGLLQGYETITGITERRAKYLNESGYQGKKVANKGKTSAAFAPKPKVLMEAELSLYAEIESK